MKFILCPTYNKRLSYSIKELAVAIAVQIQVYVSFLFLDVGMNQLAQPTLRLALRAPEKQIQWQFVKSVKHKYRSRPISDLAFSLPLLQMLT